MVRESRMKRELNKKEIQSLVASVFEAKLAGYEVFFTQGEKYRFEVTFTVHEDHLKLFDSDVKAMKLKYKRIRNLEDGKFEKN